MTANPYVTQATIKAHLERLYNQDAKLDEIYLMKKAILREDIAKYENKLSPTSKKELSK